MWNSSKLQIKSIHHMKMIFMFSDEKWWFQGDCAWETGKAGKHNWAGMQRMNNDYLCNEALKPDKTSEVFLSTMLKVMWQKIFLF
jgi:hypothetical protein